MQYQRFASDGIIESPKTDVDSRMIRIWDTGHTLHSRWAKYMEDLNILRGIWICQNHTCGLRYGKENKIGVFKPDKCKSCGCNNFSYDEVTVEDKSLNFYGHCDQILYFSNFCKIFTRSQFYFGLHANKNTSIIKTG